MGKLTRGQVVAEGLYLSGDTSLSIRAGFWLNAWLRSTYIAFTWPFLQARSSIVLPAGATSVLFGNAAVGGGPTLEVSRILNPLWLGSSDYRTKARVHIRNLTGGDVSSDESVNDPATTVGEPSQFKVRNNAFKGWGSWQLIPTPVPDKAYVLYVDYLFVPADLTQDAEVPIYPNDRTMIQAMYVEALKSQQKDFSGALNVLASMVVDDRMKYGEVAGTNDVVSLDSSVFR